MVETSKDIFNGLAILAILSWACGSRSFLGKPLALRMTPLWVGCRCFGLGVFLSTTLLMGSKTPLSAEYWLLHAVGCLCLVIGSARRAQGRCGETKAMKINSDSINEMQFKP